MAGIIDYKTERIAEILLEERPQNIEKVLVVGCGSGLEAAVLAQTLQADVTGIDVRENFDPQASRYAKLEVGDATALHYPDSTFDFIYSFHALEHIHDPLAALTEMKRVMKDDAGYWIGTPNRSRLLGYLGSKHASTREKIQWNLVDWRKRLTGSFRNELGAHAGYTASELGKMLGQVFRENTNVSDAYYLRIYSTKKPLIRFLIASRLHNIAYPAVYYMGAK